MAILIAIAFVSLGYRLVDLQVVQHDRLRKHAERNTHQTLLLQTRRGEVRDRRGNVLASSMFVKTVCANPSLIGGNQAEVARVLSPLLEIPEEVLLQKLQVRTYLDDQGRTRRDEYEVLKRKVPLETWEKIQHAMNGLTLEVQGRKLNSKELACLRDLRNAAIFAEGYEDQIRIYPNRTLAAHVLGFVGSSERQTMLGQVRDLAGADGVELTIIRPFRCPGWRTTEVGRRVNLWPFAIRT